MFYSFCSPTAIANKFVHIIFDIIVFEMFFYCRKVQVVKSWIQANEKLFVYLHLVDFNFEYNIFVNIIVRFQQIYSSNKEIQGIK